MKNQSYKFFNLGPSKEEKKKNVEENLLRYAIDDYLRSKSRLQLIKLIKLNTNENTK